MTKQTDYVLVHDGTGRDGNLVLHVPTGVFNRGSMHPSDLALRGRGMRVVQDRESKLWRATGEVLPLTTPIGPEKMKAKLIDAIRAQHPTSTRWVYDWPHRTTEKAGPEMEEAFRKAVAEQMDDAGIDFKLGYVSRRFVMYFSDGNYQTQRTFLSLLPHPHEYPFTDKDNLRARFNFRWSSVHRDAGAPYPAAFQAKVGTDLSPCLYMGPAWMIRFSVLGGKNPCYDGCRVYLNDDAEFLFSDWCQREGLSTYGDGIDLQLKRFDLRSWIIGPCFTNATQKGGMELVSRSAFRLKNMKKKEQVSIEARLAATEGRRGIPDVIYKQFAEGASEDEAVTVAVGWAKEWQAPGCLHRLGGALVLTNMGGIYANSYALEKYHSPASAAFFRYPVTSSCEQSGVWMADGSLCFLGHSTPKHGKAHLHLLPKHILGVDWVATEMAARKEYQRLVALKDMADNPPEFVPPEPSAWEQAKAAADKVLAEVSAKATKRAQETHGTAVQMARSLAMVEAARLHGLARRGRFLPLAAVESDLPVTLDDSRLTSAVNRAVSAITGTLACNATARVIEGKYWMICRECRAYFDRSGVVKHGGCMSSTQTNCLASETKNLPRPVFLVPADGRVRVPQCGDLNCDCGSEYLHNLDEPELGRAIETLRHMGIPVADNGRIVADDEPAAPAAMEEVK